VPQASGWGHAGDTCGWWCQLGARRAYGRLRFAGGAAGAGRVGGNARAWLAACWPALSRDPA